VAYLSTDVCRLRQLLGFRGQFIGVLHCAHVAFAPENIAAQSLTLAGAREMVDSSSLRELVSGPGINRRWGVCLTTGALAPAL
jgi:hypothetical protein